MQLLNCSCGMADSSLGCAIASSANAASSRLDGGSLLGALGPGAVPGLVWSPRSAPLLGSALGLVASEGGLARGGVILGLSGPGAAMSLVAVAYGRIQHPLNSR